MEEAQICPIEKRFEASLVLGGAGDALGYKNGAYEFCRKGSSIISEVESFPGGLAGLRIDPRNWMVSDDTVMTLATARALLSDWDTPQKLYSSFAREYIECMGDMNGRAPGNTCRSSIPLLKPDVRNGYQILFNPRGGGCGAAMRAAPIGLLYYSPDHIKELVAVAIESGRMTHYNPTGYLGSLAAALFVSYAAQRKPLNEWGAGLMDTLELAWEYIEGCGRDVADNRTHWDYFKTKWEEYLQKRNIQDGKTEPVFPDKFGPAERDDFYKSISFNGWGGASGHDAPMIAYDALLGCGGSWEELCKRGMFHGGDSDSTGIIAGTCWGAMYGFKGVPEGHYSNLEYRDKLNQLAKSLYQLSLSSLPSVLIPDVPVQFKGDDGALLDQTVANQFMATMVLAAVGDSLGYCNGAFEFCKSGKSILAEVKKMGGVKKISVCKPSWRVSDDTVMTLATADALVGEWKTHKELWPLLAKEYRDCMGNMGGRSPGMTCMGSAQQLNWKDPVKGHQIPFNPYGGGCGAAMRSAPIGLLYSRPEDIENLVAVAVESGRMTHYHPTGYLGSLATALFVSYGIQKKPLHEWGAGLMDTLNLAWKYIEESGRDVEQNRKHWEYFQTKWTDYLKERRILDGKSAAVFPQKYGVQEWEALYTSVSYNGWGGASGHDAPLIAYDALLGCGGSWEELCKRGMFHGGDSDSTGIIAGACWGAMNGFEGVFERNYRTVEFKDKLIKLAQQLHEKSTQLKQ